MKIVYHAEKDGQSPVQEFLDKLPKNVRARFADCFEHLIDNEGRISGVMFKKLHGYPMEEIRIKESKNLHRVLIHIKLFDSILILHGFT